MIPYLPRQHLPALATEIRRICNQDDTLPPGVSNGYKTSTYSETMVEVAKAVQDPLSCSKSGFKPSHREAKRASTTSIKNLTNLLRQLHGYVVLQTDLQCNDSSSCTSTHRASLIKTQRVSLVLKQMKAL